MAKNPHMSITAISNREDLSSTPSRRLWRCDYCGVEGLMDDVRAQACTYVYPPCTYCGQTPECAVDCRGVLDALGRSNVHVIGELPKKLRN